MNENPCGEKEYRHGGDVYSRQVDLDYSANINPLGLPRGVKEEILKCVREEEVCCIYPDSACRGLCRDLAKAHGVPEEWIICGNGAADLIFVLAAALRPKRALVPAPSFLEYNQALAAAGCVTDLFYLKEEEGFELSAEKLAEKIRRAAGEQKGYGILFLCNPNNPTGIPVSGETLRFLAEVCGSCKTFLVVDECFCDFLPEPEKYSVTDSLGVFSNLFVLKAFTKLYAMAGMRLGYGICKDGELLRRMNRLRQPWPVSGLAQRAGQAALKEKEYVERARSLIGRERERMRGELQRLGFQVYPSLANYLFFRDRTLSVGQSRERADVRNLQTGETAWLYHALLEKKVLIRSCGNYPGLDNSYYRICIRTAEENERFLSVLKQVLWERGEGKGEQKWQNQL